MFIHVYVNPFVDPPKDEIGTSSPAIKARCSYTCTSTPSSTRRRTRSAPAARRSRLDVHTRVRQPLRRPAEGRDRHQQPGDQGSMFIHVYVNPFVDPPKDEIGTSS